MPSLRWLVIGLAVLSGCPAEPPCSPLACPTGCCDAEGICQLGTKDTACGEAGACTACEPKSACDPESRTCRQRLKPQLMFVVTRSGSTAQPTNPADANCPASCFPSCPAACPTRLSAIKSAIASFSAVNGTRAWLSLAMFPTATSATCGATQSSDILVPPGAIESDLDADLQGRASTVSAIIQQVVSLGGTPLGPSLQFLAGQPDLVLARRKTYVVVMTGMPNCNSSNPNTCSGSQCRCTLTSCTGTFCTQGCLDQDGTTKGVAALVAKKAIPVLIGVGAEINTSDGRALLDALAKASPYRRSCTFDADCGGSDVCTSGVCGRSYYLATTATELGTALQHIASSELAP